MLSHQGLDWHLKTIRLGSLQSLRSRYLSGEVPFRLALDAGVISAGILDVGASTATGGHDGNEQRA